MGEHTGRHDVGGGLRTAHSSVPFPPIRVRVTVSVRVGIFIDKWPLGEGIDAYRQKEITGTSRIGLGLGLGLLLGVFVIDFVVVERCSRC